MTKRIRRVARPAGEGRLRIDPRSVESAPAASAPEVEASTLPEGGRRRVNPHEARSSRRIARSNEETGRTRIDIGEGSTPALREQVPGRAAAGPAEAPLRLDEPSGYVIVASFEDEPWSDAERELLGAARALADQQENTAVLLMRFNQSSAACDAAANGVDRLITMSELGQPDRIAAMILATTEVCSPRHIIFADAPVDGDIARRVAVALQERPAVAVVKLKGGMATGRCDGGRSEYSRPAPRILLLAPGTGDPIERGPRREARELSLAVHSCFEPSDAHIIDLGLEPIDASAVPLDQAMFIVSAGDGVTDWPGFHDVAKALSAAIGGSRQVCDAGHLPRSRQIGASGTLVAAKCYLAFGISGAPQHLQGIAQCRHVVAINTDLHAAMVKRADLAIIADAQDVMPALSALAREHRNVG